MSAATVTVALDDDQVALDPAAAERLYDVLWEIALTARSRAALAAAVRLRALSTHQPTRTIRFVDDEAEQVRSALAQMDAESAVSRESAASAGREAEIS